ncbi:MAG TPA: DUF6262 family protein [Coleofasciculaceae cyanobacterium]|jgi:ACT domain-containing protein
MSDKQIRGLSLASKKKQQEALLKTEKAIAKLTDNNQKITIRSVAREAGVSTSYIYKYPELAYNIQRLREQQKYSLVKGDSVSKKAEQQVKILQREKAELLQEIEKLKASIGKVKAAKNSLNSLQSENIQLITQNQQLQKELRYAQENLHEAREFILSQGYNLQDEGEIN